MSSVVYIVAIFAERGGLENAITSTKASCSLHIERLRSCSDPRITKVLFVVNSDAPERVDGQLAGFGLELSALIGCPVEICVRPNTGYSYGAWEYGVQRALAGPEEYAFLIEDDYVPAVPNFLDPFLAESSARVGFVAQQLEALPGHIAPVHAAVSNGLLALGCARVTLDMFGRIFAIYPFAMRGGDHILGTENQVTFLALAEAAGFCISDVADSCSIPYHDTPTNGIRERGQASKPAPLVPVSTLVGG